MENHIEKEFCRSRIMSTIVKFNQYFGEGTRFSKEIPREPLYFEGAPN